MEVELTRQRPVEIGSFVRIEESRDGGAAIE